MAAKRGANKQLTQDNWEEEDIKEEAGVFLKASKDTLERRQIKKAVRRSHASVTDNDNSSGKSVFTTFSLTSKSLSNNQNTLTTNGIFSSSKENNRNNINGDASNNQSLKISPFIMNGQTTSDTSKSNSVVDIITSGKSSHSSEYYKQLGALNKSVSDWIRQHVDKNPYCILTPIFKDYENHLKSIELSPETSADNIKPHSTSNTTTDSDKKDSTHSTTASSKTFSGFTFGNNNTSFNVAATSMVAKLKQNEGSVDSHDEDSDYEPPVPEEINLSEDGSVYSIKCKLFYTVQESYQNKGVGTLFIKQMDDKSQLIIRTDTTTSIILLNIRLSKNIPCSRVGKNNVAIYCIPHPKLECKEIESNTPVSFLIRVKTEKAADELLSKINEFKEN